MAMFRVNINCSFESNDLGYPAAYRVTTLAKHISGSDISFLLMNLFFTISTRYFLLGDLG